MFDLSAKGGAGSDESKREMTERGVFLERTDEEMEMSGRRKDRASRRRRRRE